LEKRKLGAIIIILMMGVTITLILVNQNQRSKGVNSPPKTSELRIELPSPRYDSDFSIEETLLKRRSIREYKDEPLKLQQVSQLLWATQGITDPRGFRTAPSAGALYPLEVYAVVGKVETLKEGVYKYNPQEHELVKRLDGDRRVELAEAALDQSWVQRGAITVVITAVYDRTTVKYGERGVRYVHMEAGHAAQNMCLQATAMDLGTVTVGAFHDEQVREILSLSEDEQPLYILPVGKK
jgi:SagB-type dehydrogenase family enzyme